MTELTSRSRDAATPEERGHDERRAGPTDRPRDGSEAGRRRPRGHDPVPGEIDVDGAPMAVDRCRHCGIVVLDPERPGGPCPGPNHTLSEFGIVPTTDRDWGPSHSSSLPQVDFTDRYGKDAGTDPVSTPLPR